MKQYFSAITYGDDPLANLISKIVNVIINLSLAVTTASILLNVTNQMAVRSLYYVLIFGVITLIARVLYSNNHFVGAVILMIANAFVVVLGLILSEGTVLIPSTSIIFIAIALSGLVFGLRGSLSAAATGIVLLGVTITLESNGLLPQPDYKLAPMTVFTGYSFLFAAAGTIIGLTQRTTKNAIDKFHREFLAHASLIKEERKLTGAIEQTPLATCLLNSEGRITFVNESYVHLMGRSKDDLLGESRFDTLAKELGSERAAEIKRVLENKKTYTCEIEKLIDSEHSHYFLSISPIFTEEGELEVYIETIDDITKRKHLEVIQDAVLRVFHQTSGIQNLNEIYEMLYEELNQLMDAKSMTVAILDEAREIIDFPFSIDELDEEGLESIPYGVGMTSKVIKEQRLINLSLVDMREEGALKYIGAEPICWMGAPLTYSRKTFGAILVQRYSGKHYFTPEEENILQVISKHLSAAIYNAEVALELVSANQRITEVTENIPEAFWIGHGDYNDVVFVNSAIETLTGYAKSEIDADPGLVFRHIHPQFQADVTIAMQRQQRGEHTVFEFLYKRADGNFRWLRTEAFPISREEDGSYRVVGYIQDVTPIREAENRLKTLNEDLEKRVELRTIELRESRDKLQNTNKELEKALKSKDEFFASMSHELRTPLTGILGLSEALQYQIYGEVNDQQLNMIKNIELSGKHLLELINDILDVAKMEAGRLTVDLQPVIALDLCSASLQLTKGMAKQKRINVEFINETKDLVFNADSKRMKQILVNLLSNAIKFTPEGGQVKLELRENTENNEVLFSVRDNGIGIRDEERDKLFIPFVQLETGLTKRHSGTGLGLALVTNLVGLHNGLVSLESNYGEGSCFTVTLPKNQGDKTISDLLQNQVVDPSVVHQASDIGKGQRVMVIDDNELITSTLRDFLTANGFVAKVYLSGVSALKNILNDEPDIVLCDIQMPIMDGFEVIRRIREMGDRYSMIPIVAVTALAMEMDQQKCLDAGADHYLAKPFSLEGLAKLLDTDEFRHKYY